jgi:hypothetical protein
MEDKRMEMQKEGQKLEKPNGDQQNEEKYGLVLDDVYQTKHKTRNIDAKRIAIKATDEFLKKYEDEIEINKLLAMAVDYEQMIYESAKRLNLTCKPLEEEKLRTRDFEPLNLHTYMKPYEGKFITIGGKDEIGKLLNTRSISKRIRNRVKSPSEAKITRTAICKIRR